MNGYSQSLDRWYRHPWVWFILCIPFSAVLFGAVMMIAAVYQPDDLVVDDYYREGMGINQRLRQDELAVSHGASATLIAVTEEGALFRVTGGSGRLFLQLFHVTSQNRDLKLPMMNQGDMQYTVASRLLSEYLGETGIWYLEVQDMKLGWRLRRRIVTPIDAMSLLPKQAVQQEAVK